MRLHHNLDHVGLIEGAAASVGRGFDLPPAQRPWARIWISSDQSYEGRSSALGEARKVHLHLIRCSGAPG